MRNQPDENKTAPTTVVFTISSNAASEEFYLCSDGAMTSLAANYAKPTHERAGPFCLSYRLGKLKVAIWVKFL